MRIAGERWLALTSTDATADPSSDASSNEPRAALAYAFVDARAGAPFEAVARPRWTDLGAAPLLVRPLRLTLAAERLSLPRAARALVPNVALIAPFGGRARAGVREIATKDPRITRLWDRFSIDVGVAIERNAAYFTERIFDRRHDGYRVLIFEDGDRYAIRAMCIFRVKEKEAKEGEGSTGYVMELLHDRSVTGMRAASHLVGLAVREMSGAGADAVVAWSLGHSGTFPILARHGFLPPPAPFRTRDLRFGVRAFDPALEDIVSHREHWYLSYLDAED
jgi:hypothetical protein